MRRLLTTAVLGCLLLPAAAWGSGTAVIKDCTDDGVIQGHYSQQDYKDALANLPTDVDEYTDCRDVIKRAQTGGGSSGGPGAPGGTGGTPTGGDPLASATASERAAVAKAQASGASAPVKVGGKLVQPGKLGFGGLGSPTKLPASLIAVLVAIGIAAVAAGAQYVRNRVIARRSA
ncbi:MAG: hypothetical protein E6G41_13330 [Actinobacteria bacterium]|nr:MAG: hypothetical protein E6G41_13330 [Actinomycetota bacterium]